MKKVITYGTFDLIHEGHINILKRAKELGDHLTVAVSSDSFNNQKNKRAYHNYKTRKFILEAIRYVDDVIPENNWEQKADDIKRLNIDTFVMGDDWAGKFDYLKEYCEVIYLPRTSGVSSTQIKNDLFRVDHG
ncbi:glycerol-3-phosphate cytidylyltransferase [Sediminibacillus massiliensis]|uniref:glycerol-3-phosphate cytidylyltransferase n=1 Tax=Sediminibacillus massiliensis TaxID=1926277 RepID=UPI0009883816|nr:glycerol-3-phosphate cytidylyltransferase [Sediminibacillus massiliensis]